MTMFRTRHNFLMTFDEEYRERHEFIQEWVKHHVKPGYRIFFENWSVVLFPFWIIFLFTRSMSSFIPFLGYFFGCFLYSWVWRARAKKMAKEVWKNG
jgi:hypothetical protein